jgi:hypothetical protein
MTDLASGPKVGAPSGAINRNTVRAAAILAVLVAAAVALVFTVAGARGSGAVSLIAADAKANFSAHSVSCHKVGSIPALTSQSIFACEISGVERANRPLAHPAEATFTRCFIGTAGDQTVDVSRAVSVISQDHGKTAPCS